MWMARKIFTRAASNLFLIDFPDILSFLLSLLLLFCVVVVFCLFICFLKLKVYILIHIRLCGRVNDKKIFTRLISGHKATFWGA